MGAVLQLRPADQACPKCGGLEFYESTKACRACAIKASARWAKANPEKRHQHYLAFNKKKPKHRTSYLYKIDFDALWKKQGGLCASCGKPMEYTGQTRESVHVDHDRSCCPGQYSCGKCVRGLLHGKCNLLIGQARDDVELLKAAIQYLESRKNGQT